mgnify:CR=1 FL=1
MGVGEGHRDFLYLRVSLNLLLFHVEFDGSPKRSDVSSAEAVCLMTLQKLEEECFCAEYGLSEYLHEIPARDELYVMSAVVSMA